ncbi:dehydrodolichyl diphosphate synthase CPT3-like [Impatiens glandulifera]|uniref:dehydrodolichyl diphosphate synthase CPT3-like n=1 Tax=Impatiens glandulifera TaxID=253017 RepID=UPI001FB07087|nr:dehydrodolichyl diphosphate synthase CPT3-like [Impatiens glandulifera]
MDKVSSSNQVVRIARNICAFARKCVFQILSVGPLPNHIAFIMDGNRRFAKQQDLAEGSGHKVGFFALMTMLQYCYELGLKFVTIYAFSIDNFKRRPEEVQYVMELMQEKIEGLIKEESIVNRYGVRVYFIGNLDLLTKPVRLAAERAMAATSGNSRAVLSICMAYTSTNEIVHAVQEACNDKRDEIRSLEENGVVYEKGEEFIIRLRDVERHMYMAAAPDPDIIVRTSGETRLSNFLLWQSTCSYLYSPAILWPEIGFRHLFWAIMTFQRNFKAKKEELEITHVAISSSSSSSSSSSHS